jgi:DNA-binding transcriptional LysR family regulator
VGCELVVRGRRQYSVYHLTSDGRQALETYHAILALYAQATGRADERVPGDAPGTQDARPGQSR